MILLVENQWVRMFKTYQQSCNNDQNQRPLILWWQVQLGMRDMAIYNIFDYGTLHGQKEEQLFIPEAPKAVVEDQGSLFSALAARMFFFVLLVADIAWGVYSICALLVKLVLSCLTFHRLEPLKRSMGRTFLSFKRSLVCAIALFVALFSPALGIMFSCMYFLMYDKTGVDEIVPSSLKDQFKDIFPTV